MRQHSIRTNKERRDFFISYAGSDQPWAEWIAEQLEAAGYTVFIQAWDVRPGANIVAEIDTAAHYAERTVLVLSPAYLHADDAFAEWTVAFHRDPKGTAQRVLPVRVGSCDLKGLLGPLVPIDLVGLNEEEARQRLLAGVRRERAKPAYSPFPHASTHPPQECSQLKESQQKSTQIQPITVLFMASNPQNASRLALDEEMRAIAQKVRTSEHRDALVFQCAWAARPDDLLQCLNQHRPQIVHFSGHGRSEGLSFIGDDGQEKLVPTRALQAVFSTLKDNIQLVVLNTCYVFDNQKTSLALL